MVYKTIIIYSDFIYLEQLTNILISHDIIINTLARITRKYTINLH